MTAPTRYRFPGTYDVPPSPHADVVRAAVQAGHPISVTALGPRWVTLCDCGKFGELGRRFASKRAAVQAGLDHACDVICRARIRLPR